MQLPQTLPPYVLYLEGHLESVVHQEPPGKYISLIQKDLDHFRRLSNKVPVEDRARQTGECEGADICDE